MPKTILIVDDHSDTRIICRELLTHYGFRAVEARSGAEALAMVEGELPDLILLDFLMPEQDGLQVLTQLRTSPAMASTPIVLYTAAAARVDEIAAHPLVTRVLLKPVEAKRLLNAVYDLIGMPEIPA